MADETNVVHSLVAKVAGIVVEPERFPAPQCIDGSVGGGEVKGDFGGMYLEAETDAFLIENIQDRVPEFRELPETFVDLRRIHRRKRIEEMPDAASHKSADDVDSQASGRPGGHLHFFDRSGSDPCRIAVPPHTGRENRLVALFNAVAHRLPHQMIGDGVAFQTVALENFVAGSAIALLLDRPDDVEVVAPAGELHTVVPE